MIIHWSHVHYEFNIYIYIDYLLTVSVIIMWYVLYATNCYSIPLKPVIGYASMMFSNIYGFF